MHGIDEVDDTEDHHVGTEVFDEVSGTQVSSIKNDDTHNTTTDAGENPTEFVGGVVDRAETENDFEKTAQNSVGGNDNEVPGGVLFISKE